ncbi:hypothetical protein C8R44DRAFT_725286 [Mycena epipterygia]|nr:hypothetical protein C8R44DRAFT_725286 [Mycena epipterygia]
MCATRLGGWTKQALGAGRAAVARTHARVHARRDTRVTPVGVADGTNPHNATQCCACRPRSLGQLVGEYSDRNYGPHSGAQKLIIIPRPSSIHSPECMDTNMAQGNEWVVGAEGVPTRTTSSGSSKAGNAPIIMFEPGPPEVC